MVFSFESNNAEPRILHSSSNNFRDKESPICMAQLETKKSKIDFKRKRAILEFIVYLFFRCVGYRFWSKLYHHRSSCARKTPSFFTKFDSDVFFVVLNHYLHEKKGKRIIASVRRGTPIFLLSLSPVGSFQSFKQQKHASRALSF